VGATATALLALALAAWRGRRGARREGLPTSGGPGGDKPAALPLLGRSVLAALRSRLAASAPPPAALLGPGHARSDAPAPARAASLCDSGTMTKVSIPPNNK
jgi:hypothetical protein